MSGPFCDAGRFDVTSVGLGPVGVFRITAAPADVEVRRTGPRNPGDRVRGDGDAEQGGESPEVLEPGASVTERVDQHQGRFRAELLRREDGSGRKRQTAVFDGDHRAGVQRKGKFEFRLHRVDAREFVRRSPVQAVADEIAESVAGRASDGYDEKARLAVRRHEKIRSDGRPGAREFRAVPLEHDDRPGVGERENERRVEKVADVLRQGSVRGLPTGGQRRRCVGIRRFPRALGGRFPVPDAIRRNEYSLHRRFLPGSFRSALPVRRNRSCSCTVYCNGHSDGRLPSCPYRVQLFRTQTLSAENFGGATWNFSEKRH